MSGKPFKPSFYTATLVYTITIIVLVIILSGIMIQLPEARANMSIFVLVVAVGGTIIVVQTLSRIQAAEKAYAQAAATADTSNSLLSCPDDYVASATMCTQATVNMSLDDTIVAGSDAAKLEHTARAVSGMDVQTARTVSSASFVNDYCNDASNGWSSLPWATYKALCPAPGAAA